MRFLPDDAGTQRLDYSRGVARRDRLQARLKELATDVAIDQVGVAPNVSSRVPHASSFRVSFVVGGTRSFTIGQTLDDALQSAVDIAERRPG